MSLMYSIRLLLSRENKRRDNEPHDDTYEDVYVEKVLEDGSRVEVKVLKVSCSLDFYFLSMLMADCSGIFGSDR